MDRPGQRHPAPRIQNGEYMTGHHDPADRKSDHVGQQEQISHGSQETDGAVPSLAQASIPFPVQNVV